MSVIINSQMTKEKQKHKSPQELGGGVLVV